MIKVILDDYKYNNTNNNCVLNRNLTFNSMLMY